MVATIIITTTPLLPQVSAVSLGVPCPLPAPRLTPSPHLQRSPGFIQLCPRAPSCLPPPLSGLEDLDPCHPATLPKTRWTPQPQLEVLRTRGLQGRERPSQFAPVLVPPPPPPHLCPPTPWGTTPPPAPWTPTSCNNMNISEAQLISAICMMMEHLHFDCCILSPFWSQSLFGTFALWTYANVESKSNYIMAGTCVFPTSLLQKTPPWSTPIIVTQSHCLVYITRHLKTMAQQLLSVWKQFDSCFSPIIMYFCSQHLKLMSMAKSRWK